MTFSVCMGIKRKIIGGGRDCIEGGEMKWKAPSLEKVQ